MSVWREVGRRYVVWLLMVSATVAGMLFIAYPLKEMPRAELVSIHLQLLLVGSALALSLSYFSVRLNDERISRAMAGCMILALVIFPDYVWGTLGRVFHGVEPVISALLVMLAASVALNLGLYLLDRGGRGGKKPS